MIILGSQQDGVWMSDQAGLCSVGQKALGEDVSATLGAILTLPFELHFCRAQAVTSGGRESRLKSTTVDTERRNLDKPQN